MWSLEVWTFDFLILTLEILILIKWQRGLKVLIHVEPSLNGDDEDCSTAATFRGVLFIIKTTQPAIVILENVDSIDAAPGQNSEEEQKPLETQYSLQSHHICCVYCVLCSAIWLCLWPMTHDYTTATTMAVDSIYRLVGFGEIESIYLKFMSNRN